LTLEEAPAFLDPKLRDALPDPSTFKDMDTAAARLVAALQKGDKIAVFGDYDVDGADIVGTFAAIFARCRQRGAALCAGPVARGFWP
jgi:single-stranded-DNA-specific exonuclease